ncbi:MAG TPA: DUF427 domain-containing protein [Solirubrobacteraceae bacterium]|jgi:uncharacterized protein (DUF427 family)|nr:DUF427 domain-containing protein [Solirubrobacteraceae bacterium]
MALMAGNGPFGHKPAGRFNFEPPPPGRALYLDPSPKRIRVMLGGETIADSRRAFLLHESGHMVLYYFPPEDVRSEFLEPTEHHSHCPKKGDASYYTLRAGDRVVENGAWYYPTPLEHAPDGFAGLVAFYFDKMDAWLEEDEQIFGHARDPYHRVDVISTSDHLRFSLNGEALAETTRALALFESNLVTRWYIPRGDVIAGLEPSDTHTVCPYKGTAGYYSVRLGDGTLVEDLVWFYEDPLPEVSRIAGCVCFYNEKVEISLNGEPLSARAPAVTSG